MKDKICQNYFDDWNNQKRKRLTFFFGSLFFLTSPTSEGPSTLMSACVSGSPVIKNMRKRKVYKNLKLMVSIYLYVLDFRGRRRRQSIISFEIFLMKSGLQNIVSTSCDIRLSCIRKAGNSQYGVQGLICKKILCKLYSLRY